MSIDSSTDAGNDTGTASEDSASLQTFPTTVETPALDLGQAASQDDADVIAEDGSIKVDSPAQDQGSLKTPDTASQTTNTQAPPARDFDAELAAYEKRVKDQQAGFTRSQQQLKQLQTQYQGVDPAAVKAFQESQKRAEQEKLPVWNKQNPAHAGFTKTLDKWQTYKNAVTAAGKPRAQGEDPALAAQRVAVIKEAYGSTFSNDEANHIASWEQHTQEFNQSLAMDPRGTFESIARDIARQEFQQQALVQQADHTVGAWINDPKNADILKKYGPTMEAALKAAEGGDHWTLVRENATLRDMVDRLQSRTGENQKTADQAKAQQSLLRGKATVSRDGKASPIKDPAAEAMRIAKQRGWRSDDPRMMSLIHELSTKQ